MTNIWNMCYLFAAAELLFDFERVLRFFAAVRPSFAFLLSFFLGGATAATMKSEAAVDGNIKDVTDRVASLQARLGSRKLKNYAARASPLWYEYE